MITLDGLSKTYAGEGHPALDDVSLAIPQGAVYGILGRSGAGKSTLLRCLNLLERPTSGRILMNGVDITRLDDRALRQHRQRTAMVFQHFNLLHARTVADNVAVPLEIAGVPRAARRERVAELLALVGLADKADAFPSRLSGGQKQRVGIARALAARPDVKKRQKKGGSKKKNLKNKKKENVKKKGVSNKKLRLRVIAKEG